ncbi:MAG: hypothetical protein H7Y28_00330 [Rhodoferax sp.]|nr:hypothetical protein [Rhodoferax sp.]
MPVNTFRMLQSLCLLSLTLAAHFPVSAQERSQSLQERRLGLIKGTSKGVVIYEFGKSEPATPPAPTHANAAANAEPAAKPSSATATAPQAPTTSGFLNALPPPSGRSLNAARRLDAPDQGLAIPTARDAAKAQTEPPSKP